MTPHDHSHLMVRDMGGNSKDYDPINFFIDSSKLYYPLPLHRMFTHNTFFISVVEKIFGNFIINSDGIEIPTRRICEEHFKQDFNGKIPSIQDWVKEVNAKVNGESLWMNRPKNKDLEYLKKNIYKHS